MENLRLRAGYDPAFELTELPMTVPVLACLFANLYVFAQAWAGAVRLTFHQRHTFISAHSLADALSFHVLDPTGCGAQVAVLLGVADVTDPFSLTVERFAAVLDALKDKGRPHEHTLAGAALDEAERLIGAGWAPASSAAHEYITAAYNLGMDFLCACDPEFELYLESGYGVLAEHLREEVCPCPQCCDVREGRTLFAQWAPTVTNPSLQRLHAMIGTFYALDPSVPALNTENYQAGDYDSASDSDSSADADYQDAGSDSVYEDDFASDADTGSDGSDVGDALSDSGL